MPARQDNPNLTPLTLDSAIVALSAFSQLSSLNSVLKAQMQCDATWQCPEPGKTILRSANRTGGARDARATFWIVRVLHGDKWVRLVTRSMPGATSTRAQGTDYRLAAASSFFQWTVRLGVRVLAGNRCHVRRIAGQFQPREGVAIAGPVSKRDDQEIGVDFACCLDVRPTA